MHSLMLIIALGHFNHSNSESERVHVARLRETRSFGMVTALGFRWFSGAASYTDSKPKKDIGRRVADVCLLY